MWDGMGGVGGWGVCVCGRCVGVSVLGGGEGGGWGVGGGGEWLPNEILYLNREAPNSS